MMDKSEAVASLEKQSSATSSNAGTSQVELVPIEVVVSSSEICQATGSLNPGTSQGEDPSPSATNGIEVVVSSSEICEATSSLNPGTSQGEDPSPSATNEIEVVVSSSEICEATSNLNPGTSQGEDPSPSATNGRDWPKAEELDKKRALCGPLLQAAIKGDWPKAEAFLKDHPECVGYPITKEEATALHVAVIAQRTSFVKELLKLMRDRNDYHKLMESITNYGFTALHSAAQVGNVKIAQQLFEMNKQPQPGKIEPLYVAAYQGHAKMALYLLRLTPLGRLTKSTRMELLSYTIYNELYDVALEILKKDPQIPKYRASADATCGSRVLNMLAMKPFAIGSESQLSFWKSLFKYSWFKGIYNKALKKTLAHQLVELLWKEVRIPDKQLSPKLAHSEMITSIFEAAKVGNVEFLIILAHSYPDLLWQQNEQKITIFHIAIEHRHESVFNLIYEIGAQSIATYTNSDTNDNMLHLAGKLAPQDRLNIVSGAALQMQRELLWFKEIEKIMPLSLVTEKNSKGNTPKQIFVDEHKKLQEDGEKWMKDTANYCMLVATLIATVIFAATFTLPGGSNQETGTPIFLRRTWFTVFFISNAITLCSASTSIVIFLSILTSRYTEEDFLKSLPLKLAFGLATLFISIAGMMVAFSATCFLVYSNVRAWAPVVVITSTSLPVTLFFFLHHKLWVDASLSTYTSRFLFHPCKERLFQRKMPVEELQKKISNEGKL